MWFGRLKGASGYLWDSRLLLCPLYYAYNHIDTQWFDSRTDLSWSWCNKVAWIGNYPVHWAYVAHYCSLLVKEVSRESWSQLRFERDHSLHTHRTLRYGVRSTFLRYECEKTLATCACTTHVYSACTQRTRTHEQILGPTSLEERSSQLNYYGYMLVQFLNLKDNWWLILNY